MDSPGCRPSGSASVAPPTDGLVLYRDANSSPSSGQSSKSEGCPDEDDMNEILRDIPPRRGVLPIPGPTRGSPRVDETAERAPGTKIIICRGRNLESGTAAAPTQDNGRDGSTIVSAK